MWDLEEPDHTYVILICAASHSITLQISATTHAHNANITYWTILLNLVCLIRAKTEYKNDNWPFRVFDLFLAGTCCQATGRDSKEHKEHFGPFSICVLVCSCELV